MKLYYSKGACSLSVRILIHELDIPAEFEAVDLKKKKTETGQDFLTINPKGVVPVLVLDNKEILTENVAIHQYLADQQQSDQQKSPLFFPTGFNHYRAIEWLNYIATDLHKGAFSPLFNPAIPEELKETLFKVTLKQKLQYVNDHLAKHPYLVGDHFTLPDGYLFTVLRWAPHFKIALQQWPNIARFMDLMHQHKSVQQSLEEEGLK